MGGFVPPKPSGLLTRPIPWASLWVLSFVNFPLCSLAQVSGQASGILFYLIFPFRSLALSPGQATEFIMQKMRDYHKNVLSKVKGSKKRVGIFYDPLRMV